ncbi:MAG TPA: TRAP transporter large permease subunit [Candidatus Acidoferrales bacterium]|nr:TRAP transporter large permease subunit [Candidatus Acidoferrales bacterium]
MPTSDAYELVSATRIRGTQADSVLRRIDRAVGLFVDAGTAVLLWAQVAIVLATIANRFIGRHARIEEAASDLFLWLVMFGAAAALRRGAHLRVTAVVARLPDRLRRRCETTASLLIFLFAVLLLLPADRSIVDRWSIVTPLGLHDSLRVGALLIGFALMTIVAALQLAERADVSDLLVAVNVVSLCGALLFLAKGALLALGFGSLSVFFIGLLGVCIAIGVPIAYCLGIAVIAYLSTIAGLPLDVVVTHFDEALRPTALTAVPLFIVLAFVVQMSGMLDAMVAAVRAAVGPFAGGCAYGLLITVSWAASITGFRVIDAAALHPLLFPEIRRRGGGEREMAAVLCASSALTPLVPPNIALILAASVTATAVAPLFAAALVPALAGILILALTIAVHMRDDRSEMEERNTPEEVGRALVRAAPALLPLLFMWYAVPAGVVSASEAAVLSLTFVLVLGALMYRPLSLEQISTALVEAGASAGALLFVVALAGVVVWTLMQSGFSLHVSDSLAARWTFMALSLAVFALLGAILSGLPALVLAAPLLTPLAVGFGISSVHYVIVAVLATGIGFCLPPLGGGYMRACRMAQLPPESSRRIALSYLGMLVVTLVLVAFLPLLVYG